MVLVGVLVFLGGDPSLVFSAEPDQGSSVTLPPDAFFDLVSDQDRNVARQFYAKYIDSDGIPVVASSDVADLALQRTYEIVTHMLAGRPDIRQSMISNSMYLIIIGKDQLYTDMPEYRNRRNPDYLNERVRGTGGKPTSFGEENLLSLTLDRYDDESIAVHEFCHTIDGALRSLEPGWNARKRAVFQHARDAGLWENTYALSNPGEYWAEIAQCYFDCNRVNNWNHGPVGNRDQLKAYDPEGFALVHEVFNLKPEQDWRYTFARQQPSVIPPPAKYGIDPYYTKFTWAREFPIVGREASEAALLKANDTVRKVFAYRHDILKALIDDDVKLVVLGRDESISDLPECRAAGEGVAPGARVLDYRPQLKLLVVGEEIVLGDPGSSQRGDYPVIHVFAKAVCQVTGTRSVDPNWDNRGRSVQQYELRVKRLDVEFAERLQALYNEAMSRGLWKGTSAARGPGDYWAKGVAAYFDAAGDEKPADAANPILTRDALNAYDPGLFGLVDETMAYTGHQDWRFVASNPPLRPRAIPISRVRR